MRVIQLIQGTRRRGAEVFACQLAAALRRRSHTTRVISLDDGLDGSLPIDATLRIRRESRLEKFPGVQPAGLMALRREIEDFEPDIIQLNGARTLKYGAFARWVSPHARYRLVYRNIGVSSYWVSGFARRVYYRRFVIPQMDAVVALTEGTLADLRANYLLSCPTRVIPNAIDTDGLAVGRSRADLRTAAGVPIHGQIAVFVGALSPEKRPDVFLDALGLSPTLTGWIVGDGVMMEQLRARVSSTPQLASRVKFWGRLDSIADVVSAADVLVCSSDSEGIPASVLEAAWLRVPTVAFAAGGLPDCVISGKTGLLVEPGNLAGLSHAIEEVVSEPGTRERLGASARTLVEQRFSMEVVAPMYEAFYLGLLPA